MNDTALNRKSVGGDALSSAPGGPATKVSSQNSPKSTNPRSPMSSAGQRVDAAPLKAQSSATLSPEKLVNKSSGEILQGVDPNKREVGNKEREWSVEWVSKLAFKFFCILVSFFLSFL